MDAQVARMREAAARMEKAAAEQQAITQSRRLPGSAPSASSTQPSSSPPLPPPIQRAGLDGSGQPAFGVAIRPVDLPLLTSLGSKPPIDIAVDSEVVVITGYETKDRVPEVVLDRPGQKVVLLLSTYEKVLWKVSATPGTQVQAILVSSFQKPVSPVSGPPGTRLWEIDAGYASQVATPDAFKGWSQMMRSRFGATRLDALRSDYRLAGVQRYDRPDAVVAVLALPPPPPEKASVDVRFELTTSDQRRPVTWTNAGPLVPGDEWRDYFTRGKETPGPRGTTFAISGEGVNRIVGESSKPLAPMPPSFPPVSWPTDLAYDPIKGVVALTTLGGEGFLYRYDLRADRWIDYRSLSDMDITALAFDPVTRGYAAWTTNGELLLISAQGELAGRHRLGKTMGISTELMGRPLLLAPRGSGIALIQVRGSTVQAIWTFNTATGAVQLTWRAPPPESRPTVKPFVQRLG
ncbi:MAG: hypothetical protein EOP76_11775 [Variovorax sp.]|nr:MAG: hypothetical protein EOP76_11775 [Variovorax sp.]